MLCILGTYARFFCVGLSESKMWTVRNGFSYRVAQTCWDRDRGQHALLHSDERSRCLAAGPACAELVVKNDPGSSCIRFHMVHFVSFVGRLG